MDISFTFQGIFFFLFSFHQQTKLWLLTTVLAVDTEVHLLGAVVAKDKDTLTETEVVLVIDIVPLHTAIIALLVMKMPAMMILVMTTERTILLHPLLAVITIM